MGNFVILAAINTVNAAIFFELVAKQYLQRKKEHQLMWAAGIFLYLISALLELHSELYGWLAITYRAHYFASAMLVAFLGGGTLFLLSKTAGKIFAAYSIIVGIVFAYALVTSGITVSSDNAVYPGMFTVPSSVKIFSPLLTIPGALFLIGGALYSFFSDRKRAYAILFALGGIVLSFVGFAGKYFEGANYVFGILGISLLLWGFVLSGKTRE